MAIQFSHFCILKYINEDMYNNGDEFLALFVVSCFNLYA